MIEFDAVSINLFFSLPYVTGFLSIISTVLLVFVTLLFFKETKKSRQILHQPFFAFKIMNMGMIRAGNIVIINTSASASEINLKINTIFDNFTPEHTPLTVEYFASTLITNEVVQLEPFDIDELIPNRAKIICKINCKDSAGCNYQQTIELDFNKINLDHIPYTYFPKTDE